MSAPFVGDEEYWECEHCTFVNSSCDLTCVMCYKVRVCVKDLKVTWQWQAAEQWIPYDLPATLQIEQAFQHSDSSVDLNVGWFSENDGYSITFRRPTATHPQPSHYQTNIHSGNHRLVRRVADDEAGLFIKITEEERAKGERCSICQVELDEEENLETEAKRTASTLPTNTETSTGTDISPQSSSEAIAADTVVRLSHCAPGHAFHHSCIASWIKLQDHCPYCQKRL